MDKLKLIPESIIRLSFRLSVWFIEQFYQMKIYEDKVDKLRQLKQGTLGREIAECLDKHNLRLVPGYESHDLKHVLLGFNMNPVDEIRLQAFMLGNGNVTLPSITIFLFGFVLLPYKWRSFYKDFIQGRNTIPVKHCSIEQYGEKDLNSLKQDIIKKEIVLQPIFSMQRFANMGGLLAVFLGGAGMLYCLPFLFSPVLEDLVGAGFPFVGGAILFAAGLISLSIQSNRNNKVISEIAS
ncbi:hypothetical protein [Chondrinema litorale]|uniref:hypothetical protein n=1 Tax=Chondrinema litorale TaxID=2994555 RepID=UPI002543BE8B|nr:hypothetical protein [Chondrinema litorale]UZR94598.1 hypothetical protein OQ292_02035 [Chondrinema litorale]